MFHLICLLVFLLIAGLLALCAIWFGVIPTVCAYVVVSLFALYKLTPPKR